LNVLSLFDGISCGRVALERAGIPITNYYASEIDKYAIQISKKNWPDIIHLGDINDFLTGLNVWPEAGIDLIIGGSPCQGFSFAGKQLAFDDPRSVLFWKFVEIVNYYKPKYFLLENVRMKKEYLQVITDALGVEPICINSSLVSAQNRVRYYWTNIPNVTQPEDKGVVLSDILEDVGTGWIKSHGEWHARNDKSMCLDANYFKGVDNHGQRTMIKCGQMIGRKINPVTGRRDDYNKDIKPVQRIEIREDSKTGAITTVQKDNLIVRQINPDKSCGGKQPHMQDRVYHVEGKSAALTASFANRCNAGISYGEYKKLTPVECERLQTLPDNYTEGVSNTQRYKALGNGWTVDVIAHIFKGTLT
jgi:DNA-cytosine methyltransferase